MNKRAGSVLFAVAVLLGLGLVQSAFGVPTPVGCKWPTTNDITVKINKAGFEKWGLDSNYLFRTVALAAHEMNQRAALPFTLFVSSTFTTATQPSTDEILIKSEDFGGGNVAVADSGCSDRAGGVTFYSQHWAHQYVFSAMGLNLSPDWLYTTLLHEMGHTLGLSHNNSTSHSIMAQGSLVLELSSEDIQAYRAGVCTYGVNAQPDCANCTLTSGSANTPGSTYLCGYGRRTNATIKGLASIDAASTWHENYGGVFVNIGAASNLEVGHAFGKTTSETALYVAAYVDSSQSGSNEDMIYAAAGNGTSWSTASVGVRSENGPSVAFGGTQGSKYWVIAYQARATTNPVNTLRYVTGTYSSSTGPSWNAGTDVDLGVAPQTDVQSVVSRPSIAYAPSANKFVLAWADRTTGRVRTATATPSATLAWGNAAWLGGRSARGVGIDCVAGSKAGEDDCLLAWSYHDGSNQIWTARAWTDPDSGGRLRISPPKVTGDYSSLPIDVALQAGSSGDAVKALMVFRGLTSNWRWYITQKSTTSQLTNWPSGSDPTGPSSFLMSAPSIVYSSTYDEWTSLYSVRP